MGDFIVSLIAPAIMGGAVTGLARGRATDRDAVEE